MPISSPTDSLRSLRGDEGLPETFDSTVERCYRPLGDAIARLRARHGAPLAIGICGAQGSGKSTLALFLREILRASGLHAALLSLDDLYLPRAQRMQLAARIHPLLATRGAPGTHDTALGIGVIERLLAGNDVDIPRFDKATDERAEPTFCAGPVDIVLFEGWCVGARPQPDGELETPVNALERDEDADGRWRRFVNAQLAGPYQTLFSMLNKLIFLRAPDFDCVYRWRALQEEKLRARTGRGMTTGELRRFIRHYERLTRWMAAEMPGRADAVLELDRDHAITALRGIDRSAG